MPHPVLEGLILSRKSWLSWPLSQTSPSTFLVDTLLGASVMMICLHMVYTRHKCFVPVCISFSSTVPSGCSRGPICHSAKKKKKILIVGSLCQPRVQARLSGIYINLFLPGSCYQVPSPPRQAVVPPTPTREINGFPVNQNGRYSLNIRLCSVQHHPETPW